jgi:hypothetical protein
MAVYFADQAILNSKDDYFTKDIAVGNARPTPQLMVVIHSDSNKPMVICS